MKIYAAALLLMSPGLFADTVFNYDGFYARMKKSEVAQFSDITLAFELHKTGTNEACTINKARITTDISQDELTIASNGELVLPFDQTLNDNKALIRLDQPAGAEPCDLNFKLRSKLPIGQHAELKVLQRMHGQFDQLLDSLAGLGKYWLPDVDGLTLHFATESVVLSVEPSMTDAVQCDRLRCVVLLDRPWPAEAKIQFSQTPLYATPLLAKP